jgi:UDP-N-acetylglucosamine 1-carboxyvinyltransferase
MEYIKITGKNRLAGNVQINGAKNAAVAIIPAAVASGGVCVIDNLPHVEDVMILANAIQSLGGACEFIDEHTLEIDSRNIEDCSLTQEPLKNMRGSYYFMGALLGRFGHAEVLMPGGCNFGPRPIDYHLKGFKALGAKCELVHGVMKITADKLKGANIYLDMPSVGATINIMLAAVYAEGVTHIENAAKEPHVVDTANCLNKFGANIKGAGTDLIRISGARELRGGEYSIIPDQIEAGTYMMAAAITGGDVTVGGIIPKHMDSLTAKLKDMNCEVTEGDDSIRVLNGGELNSVNIKASFYPGFPTDLQPQMTTLMCKAKGTGVISETVFANRFQYVNELKRLGADITVEDRVAIIKGGRELNGAQVNATDLRAGVALVLAGLAANGETVIGNVKYLDRGYEQFETKFRKLGADIRRAEIEE